MAADRSDDNELELIELERARIGHEIHDTLLPLVFAASASLHDLLERDGSSRELTDRDSSERQRLEQIAQWLGDALRVGRDLLVEVYPPELQRQDWQSAVQHAVSGMTDSGDRDSAREIEWDIDPKINQCEARFLSSSYRIVVEAVRNAIRHGNASKIQITAKTKEHKGEPASWTISVLDNGTGFESADVPSDRFGIRSMIGRAKLAGGSCSVDSHCDGPTSVTFRWVE